MCALCGSFCPLLWCRGAYGEHNVLSIGDDFDPDNETATGDRFVAKFASALRRPPCTPAQFAEEMNTRGARAKAKGVDLFTSGKDQPFVLDKYKHSFDELVRAEKFDFGGMSWGDDEAARFAEVLSYCKDLKILRLDNNKIGNDGASKIAEAMPHMANLQDLQLQCNQITDVGAISIAETLPHLTNLTTLILDSNQIADDGAIKIAESLPNMKSLQDPWLNSNTSASDVGSAK